MLLPMLLLLLGPQDPAAANEADIRCVAVLSATAATAPEELKSGLTGGVLFFYGRIAGRSPDFDVQAAMMRLMEADPSGEGLNADRPRCGQEMQTRGAYLMEMGKKILAAASD
ncbi:MAG: hypothetical protein EOP60_01555 [Sphingomonadales bacterium]|nr:MAG: hypothetical protein EOP60_01555 [Sphingomonadales bacterium]